jgi:hypothetical protein
VHIAQVPTGDQRARCDEQKEMWVLSCPTGIHQESGHMGPWRGCVAVLGWHSDLTAERFRRRQLTSGIGPSGDDPEPRTFLHLKGSWNARKPR